MRTTWSIAFLTSAVISRALAADDMQAFPRPELGMARYVIRLPKHKDESLLKVEIIVGKTIRTDVANSYCFGAVLETVAIPGWGFDRYILRKLGPMAGTLVEPVPGARLVERFIRVCGESIIRYNSRLPVVVYVPADVGVRYRVWRAGPIAVSAPEP